MGRTLLFLGLVLVLVGGVILLSEKSGYKNPLDFQFSGENWKFYFPLGTSILVSMVLSLFFYFFRK
jgi:hypothetical protein